MTSLLAIVLFDQTAQTSAYLLCLLAGLVYIVATSAFGAVFGGGDGHDDGSIDSGDGDHPTISIFSPKIIAIFSMGLGAGGGIASIYGASFTVALFSGLGAGVGLGALMILGMTLLHKQQASSDVPTTAAIGQIATVSIEIPAEGTGEVTLPVLGQYMTYTAQSQSSAAIPKGKLVKVLASNGGTLIVV